MAETISRTLARETGIPEVLWDALRDDPERKTTRKARVTTKPVIADALTDEEGAVIPRPPRGSRITIGAASRKYEVAQPNITRWAKRGRIHVYEAQRGKGYPTEVDEADVYDAVVLYRRAPGPGRNPLGLPRSIAARVQLANAS